MTISVRNKDLWSPTGRLKLRRRFAPYFVKIGEGLALGYRHAGENAGKWLFRKRVPGKYWFESLGKADDYEDADSDIILTFYQAQERARAVAAKGMKADQAKSPKSYTVEMAATEYMEWFKAHRKSVDRTRLTINAHIIPTLGNKKLCDLTTEQLNDWLNKLLENRKPATANRILNVLKAILTRAWRKRHVKSNSEWDCVEPFPVGQARVRYLTVAEAVRLTNACAPGFRAPVRAALLTGARYGELVALRVGDYDEDASTVYIADSKSGHPRHIPLTEEGENFFDEITAGRGNEEIMFVRADGEPWGTSHQCRPMRDACLAAKIEPRISFHILRHTYGSLLAQRGVPLQVIAAALGHSDTRVTEKHYAHLAPDYVSETIRAALPRYTETSSNVTRLRRRNG